MDERDIIKNILDGKKDDFGLLVKKYFDGVRRVCLSLCGNGFDADDATQEAFVDAFIYLPSLSDHDKFAPWLYKIARRKCFRRLSSRRTDEDIDDMAELLPANDSSPLDAAIQKEQNLRVYAALSRLSEKRRAVAEMFYFRGMKVSDIAARLDLSENTGTFSLDGTSNARTISFADNATIALKLGTSRHPSKIVGWTTAPTNLDTLTFVRSAEDAGRKYRIVKKDDGIYIITGMMIIVK